MSEWVTMAGHIILAGLSIVTLIVLHRNGIKFDVRIWRNGKDKREGQ